MHDFFENSGVEFGIWAAINRKKNLLARHLQLMKHGVRTQKSTHRKIMALETVQRKCCNQCLFSKNKIVSDNRKAEILKDCKENNNHFECHKATIKGIKVTCRAFYDKCTNPAISAMLEEIGEVEFVDIN